MRAVLGQIGVNVTPLLAGAGIVGVAVGFGAQTLVRDIISGVFFLIDDAFRKGEYIDIGSVTGTVEDTRRAVRAMVAEGVAAIVVLGGDGTHRAVAMDCGRTPIACVSTGTNNAFPDHR